MTRCEYSSQDGLCDKEVTHAIFLLEVFMCEEHIHKERVKRYNRYTKIIREYVHRREYELTITKLK